MFTVYTYKDKEYTVTDMLTEIKLIHHFSIKHLLLVLFVDLTGVLGWVSRYLFADFGFLGWLMLIMGLDLVTGVTKVWVNEGFRMVTSRGFRDSVSKVIQYGSFLIITHIVTHFEIGGEVMLVKYDWINRVAYQFLIFIESKSVYENIVSISPKLDFIQHCGDKLVKLYQTTIKTKKR